MHAQLLAGFLSLAGAAGACVPQESFVPISFTGSTVKHSNLGGQGGNCNIAGECDETPSATTPHEIYIRNVMNVNGVSVDLRITNESEYKASRPENNGLKANGEMAEVNLFGPQEGGTWGRDFTG